MSQPVPIWPVTSIQGRLVSSQPVSLTGQGPQGHLHNTAMTTGFSAEPSPQYIWALAREPALREPFSCNVKSMRDGYPTGGVPSLLPKFMATLPNAGAPPSQPPSMVESGRLPFATRPGFAMPGAPPGMIGLLDSRAGAAPYAHACHASMPIVLPPVSPHSLPSMSLPAGLHGVPGASPVSPAPLFQTGAIYASSHPMSFVGSPAGGTRMPPVALHTSALNGVSRSVTPHASAVHRLS